jgi:large subunit ribosomal protein L5
MMQIARFKKLYNDTIAPALKEQLSIANNMQIPRLIKIVVNVGTKDAVSNSKVLTHIATALEKITGQKTIRRLARKSIAGFKLREGMPIGVMVTLRDKNMYEFLDRLISLALPKVRDFQGLKSKGDGRGGYNIGIKEWTVFPELSNFALDKRVYGMNISIHTSAENDEQCLALLEKFGMPFARDEHK